MTAADVGGIVAPVIAVAVAVLLELRRRRRHPEIRTSQSRSDATVDFWGRFSAATFIATGLVCLIVTAVVVAVYVA